MNHRILLAAVALSLPLMAAAQSWPVRPLRMIVPTAPGGGTDFTGRLDVIDPARLGQHAGFVMRAQVRQHPRTDVHAFADIQRQGALAPEHIDPRGARQSCQGGRVDAMAG